MKNIETFVRIAKHIRTVPVVNVNHGVVIPMTYDTDPGCFVCEGVRCGAWDAEFAARNSLDIPYGFSEYFGVSLYEAHELVFLSGVKDSTGHAAGVNYYDAAKKLLANHGLAHLLDESWAARLMESIPVSDPDCVVVV